MQYQDGNKKYQIINRIFELKELKKIEKILNKNY